MPLIDGVQSIMGGARPIRFRYFSAALRIGAITSFTVSVAIAQPATNYITVEAVAGKQVQLTYHATAKKDCTPVAPPTIKVTRPPKQGVLMIRDAILATDRFAGCGRMKVPARVVLYEAKGGFAGSDHVSYDLIDSKGEVLSYDVTINVKAASPTATQKGTSI